jgi:hypothetical protein
MNKVLTILAGAGAGALLMYLFDPKGGNRRRAFLRAKADGLSNDAKRALTKTTKDLGNRAQGIMHQAKSLAAGQTSSGEDLRTERPA